jgi:hypothetical protein
LHNVHERLLEHLTCALDPPFHALLRRRHKPVGCSSPVKSRFSFRGKVELCPPSDSPIGRLVIQAFDTWPAVYRLLA